MNEERGLRHGRKMELKRATELGVWKAPELSRRMEEVL